MEGSRLDSESTRQGGAGFVRRIVRRRFWLYGAAILFLLLFRFIPELRHRLEFSVPEKPRENRLILTGLELAPVLIPRLAETYQRLYPDQEIRILGGGTRQALEDLFSLRADVAFLSRPLTREEESIVSAIQDSALTFPIALGAIAVLAPLSTGIDSLPVDQLRAWISAVRDRTPLPDREIHFYAPDPNLGLWTALTDQLGLTDEAEGDLICLASDHEVAVAVGRDPKGIGVASLLALPEDLQRLGVRAIPVTGSAGSAAVIPDAADVATGLYPLYHYLYVACRPRGGALASGFVSFLHSGRGQRLVAREGFLPARDVPREVILTSEPVPTSS